MNIFPHNPNWKARVTHHCLGIESRHGNLKGPPQVSCINTLTNLRLVESNWMSWELDFSSFLVFETLFIFKNNPQSLKRFQKYDRPTTIIFLKLTHPIPNNKGMKVVDPWIPRNARGEHTTSNKVRKNTMNTHIFEVFLAVAFKIPQIHDYCI